MARIFDVEVTPLCDADALVAAVRGLMASRHPTTVGYVNVHVYNEAARDPDLARYLRGLDLCYADGAGVVLASRILGRPLPARLTGADFIWDVARIAEEEQWRLGWIGGRAGVVERAVAELRRRHPRLCCVYTHHGYDPRDVTGAIEAARPDLLLVGMGTPRQERWIARWRPRLRDVSVVWGLGATHDFVSGTVSRGPPWLHRRQEWLARLMVEPRRLWKRYLVGNPTFLARTLLEAWNQHGSDRNGASTPPRR